MIPNIEFVLFGLSYEQPAIAARSDIEVRDWLVFEQEALRRQRLGAG